MKPLRKRGSMVHHGMVMSAHLEPAIPAAKTLESVADAINALTDKEVMHDLQPDATARRGDDHFGVWFRGHERLSYELVPTMLRDSVARTGRQVDEASLTRHFKALNPDSLDTGGTDFEWLVTMQHYLAPTRLLDWTENLLVALYFAVRNPELDNKQDSAIWILNARRLNYYSAAAMRRQEVFFANDPDVIARSCLCRAATRLEWLDVFRREVAAQRVDREHYRIERVATAIEQVRLPRSAIHAQPADFSLNDVEVIDGGTTQAIDFFDRGATWHEPARLDLRLRMPIAVYPNRTNRRIRTQAGVFTLHGGKHVPNPQSYRGKTIYETPIGAPIDLVHIDAGLKKVRILKWLRIPKKRRADFRRTLSRIGITDATLFPELDYQSKYLLDRWRFIHDVDED